MSKWIDELEDIVYEDTGFSLCDKAVEFVTSIDKLLRRAMIETEDEVLHEDIRKELGEDVK